jgi:hypothetical protein
MIATMIAVNAIPPRPTIPNQKSLFRGRRVAQIIAICVWG